LSRAHRFSAVDALTLDPAVQSWCASLFESSTDRGVFPPMTSTNVVYLCLASWADAGALHIAIDIPVD